MGMYVALLRADHNVPLIYRMIDVCSQYRGDPGHYGHAALLFSDGQAASAHPDIGVAIHDPKLEFPANQWDYYAAPGVICWPPIEAAIRLKAQEEVGMPYDFEGVARFIDKFSKQNPDAWFCSELVTWLIQGIAQASIGTSAAPYVCSGFADVESWKVSPNKLGKMCYDAGWMRVDPPIMAPPSPSLGQPVIQVSTDTNDPSTRIG